MYMKTMQIRKKNAGVRKELGKAVDELVGSFPNDFLAMCATDNPTRVDDIRKHIERNKRHGKVKVLMQGLWDQIAFGERVAGVLWGEADLAYDFKKTYEEASTHAETANLYLGCASLVNNTVLKPEKGTISADKLAVDAQVCYEHVVGMGLWVPDPSAKCVPLHIPRDLRRELMIATKRWDNDSVDGDVDKFVPPNKRKGAALPNCADAKRQS